MKIISGGLEVFESGNVYCPDTTETKFIISSDPRMEIIFRLAIDDAGKEGISLEAVNEYTLAIIYTNPPGLGFGNAAPIKVGHLNGKELYVNFHIEIKGKNQAYNLSYTFHLKDAQNV